MLLDRADQRELANARAKRLNRTDSNLEEVAQPLTRDGVPCHLNGGATRSRRIDRPAAQIRKRERGGCRVGQHLQIDDRGLVELVPSCARSISSSWRASCRWTYENVLYA